MPVTYVLPIKSAGPGNPADLEEYLARLSRWCRAVVVVDGSAPAVFEANHRVWSSHALHLPVDRDVRCRNGKVQGVLTGLRRVHTTAVVIADDDVRYDLETLSRVVSLTDRFDLVCPQNYFDPVPWQAAWDTARTLLNRAFGADYPGTIAVRAAALERTGGYDGDVLFENLELIRTVEAAGGLTTAPLDLYVRRLPPTVPHFWHQRIRQAYEDLACPLRCSLWLSIVPGTALLVVRFRWPILVAVGLVVWALAEFGRRRAGGRQIFGVAPTVLAPLWVAERGICSWVGLVQWFRGGVVYGGHRIRRPATAKRELRRRFLAGTTGRSR